MLLVGIERTRVKLRSLSSDHIHGSGNSLLRLFGRNHLGAVADRDLRHFFHRRDIDGDYLLEMGQANVHRLAIRCNYEPVRITHVQLGLSRDLAGWHEDMPDELALQG